MQNTLGDLNNHLFAELKRLSDEDLTGEKLKEEITRAEAITSVATEVIQNGSLVLKAKQLIDNKVDADMKLPKMLEG